MPACRPGTVGNFVCRPAKTDHIDVDLLLGALLGWLRGDPRCATMVPIPSIAEEDRCEPGREREALVAARLKVENQIGSLLIRYGISGVKPRQKKPMQHLVNPAENLWQFIRDNWL